MFSIKTKLLRRLGSVLLLAGMALGIGSGTTFGFVVGVGLSSGPVLDLHDAVRWSNVPGSLVEDSVRGLGGGIEYAVADDFCDQIIPLIVDDPKPSCKWIKETIKRAFDKWSAGHPILKFTDVTGKIKAERPPADRDPTGKGFGAEIDFFVQNMADGGFIAAITRTYLRPSPPLGTNGKELTGSTITSADIILNSNPRCYFQDPAMRGRVHPNRWSKPFCSVFHPFFEDLLMHEIGHALGLNHPHEFPNRNWDSDDDPTNEIPIDCEDPTKGLKLSPNIDRQAIMSSLRDTRGELTNDDIGGRNFLYPICPGASQALDTQLEQAITVWGPVRVSR